MDLFSFLSIPVTSFLTLFLGKRVADTKDDHDISFSVLFPEGGRRGVTWVWGIEFGGLWVFYGLEPIVFFSFYSSSSGAKTDGKDRQMGCVVLCISCFFFFFLFSFFFFLRSSLKTSDRLLAREEWTETKQSDGAGG
ncbi:hypothetical protein BGZ63DRAFT_216470 [Mariannaea sp. PMI_226]|nr:hypothetical protein BGZ63DRAFT_216470 [Mariannaea sp. PMI_226]